MKGHCHIQSQLVLCPLLLVCLSLPLVNLLSLFLPLPVLHSDPSLLIPASSFLRPSLPSSLVPIPLSSFLHFPPPRSESLPIFPHFCKSIRSESSCGSSRNIWQQTSSSPLMNTNSHSTGTVFQPLAKSSRCQDPWPRK